MDPSFRDLFTFTSGEKRGLMILSGIIIILIIFLFLRPHIMKTSSQNDSTYVANMNELMLTFSSDSLAHSDSLAEENPVEIQQLFSFNPNLVTSEQLHDLGLKSWQIAIIMKYRGKGGVFRKKEDFRKIYGLSPQQYELLEPYIKIENSPQKKTVDSSYSQPDFSGKSRVYKKLVVELNTADSADLDQLYGIGPSLASRIIKYRNRLGGFARAQQLLEVYGLKDETLKSVLPHIFIDTSKIAKIKLNSVSLDELRRHPYLSFYQAKSLIKYRELHGSFKQLNEIGQNNLLPAELISKIQPYLSFEK